MITSPSLQTLGFILDKQQGSCELHTDSGKRRIRKHHIREIIAETSLQWTTLLLSLWLGNRQSWGEAWETDTKAKPPTDLRKCTGRGVLAHM